jgi:hypothetical protein
MSTLLQVAFQDHRHRIHIFSIVLLAAILSLYQLSSKSIWYDEALSMNFAQQDIHLLFESACLFRPLYFFILRLWTALLGYGEFSARLLSVLFSVGSIWPLYLIAKRITDRQTAVLVIFFYALSPYRVIISQQIRNYSLFVLLSLLSVYFFLHILKAPSKKALRLYLASTLLFLYTHPYALFLVLTQNIYYLWSNKNVPGKTGPWFRGQSILLISSLPLLAASQLDAVKSQFGSIPVFQQTLKPLLYTFEALSYGGPFIAQGGFSLTISSPLLEAERLLMILFFACAGLSLLKTKKQHVYQDNQMTFVLIWIFLPLLSVYFLSFAKPALYQTRYVLFSLPPFIIFYSAGLVRLSRPMVKSTVIALLSGGMVLFLQNYYHGDSAEQFYSWREAAGHVRKNIEEDDALLFVPSEQITPFWYYYKDDEKKPLQFIGSGRQGQTYSYNRQWRRIFSDKTNLVLTVPFHSVYYQTVPEWQRRCEDLLRRNMTEKQQRIWLILSAGWIGRQKAQVIIDVLQKEYLLTSRNTFDFDGIEVFFFQKRN